MLALLKELNVAGLTGVKVLWTFFERRVQPLKAQAHPLYRYTGDGDPTRTSPEPLTPGEVRSRVWTVIKRSKDVEDDNAGLDHHQAGLTPEPAARREGCDPVTGSSGMAPSLGHVLGQSGDAPTSVGETPQGVVPTPTMKVGLTPPNPDVAPQETMVAHPAESSTPAVMLTTPIWERYLPCIPGPLLRAASTAALGTSGSATIVATGSTAAAEGSASAGIGGAPVAGATANSEPLLEEVPPSGAAAGERVVLDLTGDDSEGEDMAAMLEAVMETEEVEETNPEWSTALPDKVAQEVDPERSGALPDEAALEVGAQDAPLEEVPCLTASAAAAPTATVGQEAPDTMAQASDAAGVSALRLEGVAARDRTEVAAQTSGGSVPPAVLPSEPLAAEDTGRDVAPVGESQALVEPERVAAPATSGALVVARPMAPASVKGKEPAPQETLPDASFGSSSGEGVDVAASESGDELIWRHHR
ncbi:hypothetical protein BAE44_0026305, partial [Dichanthelium oligosanthes]